MFNDRRATQDKMQVLDRDNKAGRFYLKRLIDRNGSFTFTERLRLYSWYVMKVGKDLYKSLQSLTSYDIEAMRAEEKRELERK